MEKTRHKGKATKNMNTQHELALIAIRKKLLGKILTYKEIYAIMDEIAHKRLNTILTTYFAASGYSKGFSIDELYYLTKAMVETGEKLEFSGIVADKHSIGGVPGTRTTLIVVPIIAAAGFTIPKSSSRAITTPDGTADDMEVLSKVAFTKEQIHEIVHKTNGCIVWGGSVDIAPADDQLIKVEKPLMFESYDKILVSIMAKKIAFGSNHVVIDLPYGENVKIHKLKDAQELKKKFEQLAERFHIKLIALIHPTSQPIGSGIGPILETRDALQVLEQTADRPLDLEERALNLAAALLNICLVDTDHKFQQTIHQEYPTGYIWAKELLQSGKALKKMKQIIQAQQGNENLASTDLHPGIYTHQAIAGKDGSIQKINSNEVTTIAKILGAPRQKGAGIYFSKKIGQQIKKGDTLYTLHSETMYNLKEAIESLTNFPIVTL